MGARDVRVLYYAADPTLFSPRSVEQDIDVFFYGHGREYREEWIAAMPRVSPIRGGRSRSGAGARPGLRRKPIVSAGPFEDTFRAEAQLATRKLASSAAPRRRADGKANRQMPTI